MLLYVDNPEEVAYRFVNFFKYIANDVGYNIPMNENYQYIKYNQKESLFLNPFVHSELENLLKKT